MTVDFPPVTFGPVTRTDLVRYAGASGDFNPLHHDPDFARAAGFPDVIAHGMYTAGIVGAALERRWGAAALRSYKVRFRSPVRVGDTLTLAADAVTRDEATGLVEVTLSVRRQDGEVVMTAEASVLLSDIGGSRE